MATRSCASNEAVEKSRLRDQAGTSFTATYLAICLFGILLALWWGGSLVVGPFGIPTWLALPTGIVLFGVLIYLWDRIAIGVLWPWWSLHGAASDGHLRFLRRHLRRGVNPDLRNDQGTTPMGMAMMNHQDAVVALLLEGGADPNAHCWDGMPPIIMAVDFALDHLARPERVRILNLLIAHGADIEVRGSNGKTPLELAKEHGTAAAVQLLEAALAAKRQASR